MDQRPRTQRFLATAGLKLPRAPSKLTSFAGYCTTSPLTGKVRFWHELGELSRFTRNYNCILSGQWMTILPRPFSTAPFRCQRPSSRLVVK